MAARLFLLQHVVFALKRLLDYLVPDRPTRLRQKIKREHFLVQQMLLTGGKLSYKRIHSHFVTCHIKSQSAAKY